jgi:hypothetical protein
MSSAEPATRTAAAASSKDVTAAEDVGTGTAVSVKAVETTAAALRERNKVWAGDNMNNSFRIQFEDSELQ